MRSESELRSAAERAGQGHLFAFWDELDERRRTRLLSQVEALDFEQLAALDRLRSEQGSPSRSSGTPDPEPVEFFPLQRTRAQEDLARAAEQRGRQLLAAGRVGFVLVAGGQASRLGFDGPKGAFPVGPVSRRTLFEIHARRLRAAARRFGCRTPWYVMTSQQNDGPTKAFFGANQFFGLPQDDVFFFSQDMLPALDDQGRVLMSERDALFLAPNGHGGVLEAMQRSGALASMRQRGIDFVSYFQVDNPLARPADPLFLGLHHEAAAGMSTKVVQKVDPGEKVGVIGLLDGRMGIVEYSDLSETLRQARDDTGRLRFRAGNIAVHLINVDFVDDLTRGGTKLPWHLARKRMKVLGDEGEIVETWGTKFETFVFDALAESRQSVTLEVPRHFEFSPVKNAEGVDSAATARADLCRLFAGWVRAAGMEVPAPDDRGIHPVEIDPLVAESEEEFLAAGRREPRVHHGGHLYE